jgi:hypothetical protein
VKEFIARQFMSTTILKKQVEHFAPENVRKEIHAVEHVARVEHQARTERLGRERNLLETVERAKRKSALDVPIALSAS